MNAAEGGHLRAVEVLIAAGADVAAENDLGYGPHSVPQRNRGTLSDVVANCAAGALRSWRRHTKVTRAWSRCSSRLAPTCAATPGATVRRGTRPVHGCIEWCGSETALLLAARDGHADIIAMLVAAGADRCV